ncbi:MAG: protein kinase [Chloroflexi bacterium]|nr:protein kinase [Chloroflexota bacterium]
MIDKKIIANKYEVLEPIGQGGMGDVFRGRDTQTGSPVAIKLLRADIMSARPNLLERFQREGEVLRQLNHPNIVKMLDTVQDGRQSYLVMEYVGGGSLRDLLKQQPTLPLGRIVEIALEVADALTRAHHRKVIHRDLKPANILIAEDGTPRLTDFGIARLEGRSHLTDTGSLLGTYAYISPEICRSEEIDARTDIWSFGIILYEMLTGHRPFEGEHTAATLLAIINNPLPDITQYRPETPPALVQLIYRMLDKDPNQRIASARRVGAELEEIAKSLDMSIRNAIGIKPGQPSRFATTSPSTSGGTPLPPQVNPATVELSRQDVASAVSAAPPTTSPTTAPPPAVGPAAPRRSLILGVAGGIIGVLLAIGILLAIAVLGDKDDEFEAVLVDPVEPGEYLVLVAELEPRPGATERDVTRFIVEDLARVFEEEMPDSQIRVRAYPQMITSDDNAQLAAETNDALIIVWGNYSQTSINLHLQLGVTTAFEYIQIEREMLEQSTNLDVRLGDEQQQSVAPQVLTMLSVLLAADGDGYEVTRVISFLDRLDVDAAETVSGGVSGALYDAHISYLDDTNAAIRSLDDAIQSNPRNPIPYAFLGSAYLREGTSYSKVRDNMRTAQQYGPENWTLPFEILGLLNIVQGRQDEALENWDAVVEQRPDDWYPINQRGAMYYFDGDYEQAQSDFERSIELGPNASFPYLFLMMTSLREADIVSAQEYLEVIRTDYPDPEVSTRLLHATFGTETPYLMAPVFSAFGNLTLGQYDQVVVDSQEAIMIDGDVSDMYLLQGVAYCSMAVDETDEARQLELYELAEEAYTNGIAHDPDFPLFVILRAETRIRMGMGLSNSLDETDRMVIEESPAWAELSSTLMGPMLTNNLNCRNLLSYDYSALNINQEAETAGTE